MVEGHGMGQGALGAVVVVGWGWRDSTSHIRRKPSKIEEVCVWWRGMGCRPFHSLFRATRAPSPSLPFSTPLVCSRNSQLEFFLPRKTDLLNLGGRAANVADAVPPPLTPTPPRPVPSLWVAVGVGGQQQPYAPCPLQD